MALIWTGGGYGGALPDLPARDLTDDEVVALGGEDRLVATGLYARPAPAAKGAAAKTGTAAAAPLGKGKEGD